MRYHLSSSKTERFADLCSQVRELREEAREKNGYDLVAILVDDGKVGSSGSSSSSGSRQVPVEHANHGSYRLRTRRQVSEVLSLTDDDASVLGDDSEDITSRNPAAPVSDLYTKGGLVRWKKPYVNEVIEAIVERAADVGFNIKYKSRLPWKQLPGYCAKHGVYIDNYPNGVVSPFGNERTARSNTGGITALTIGERKALLDALVSEETHPMQFMYETRQTDILNNRQPVIIYAPPPSDSPYERSKRFFLDGSFDYRGHPRMPTGGKAAKKRRLENSSVQKPEKRRRPNQRIQGS